MSDNLSKSNLEELKKKKEISGDKEAASTTGKKVPKNISASVKS